MGKYSSKIKKSIVLLVAIMAAPCATPSFAAIEVRPVPLTESTNTNLVADRQSAVASYKAGEFGFAYTKYKKLLMQVPSDEKISLGLADAALAMVSHGQIYHDEANWLYTNIINTPEFSEKTVNQAKTGLLLLTCGQGNANTDELRELAQNNTDPRVWNALGRSYDKKGEWVPALEAYLNALNFSHKNGQALAPVHNNMGISLLLQKRTPEAVEKFKQAHLASPEVDLYDNNYRLGLVLTDNLPKALKDADDGQAAQLFNDAGFIAANNGEFIRARAFYQMAISISPIYFQIAENNLKSLG